MVDNIDNVFSALNRDLPALASDFIARKTDTVIGVCYYGNNQNPPVFAVPKTEQQFPEAVYCHLSKVGNNQLFQAWNRLGLPVDNGALAGIELFYGYPAGKNIITILNRANQDYGVDPLLHEISKKRQTLSNFEDIKIIPASGMIVAMQAGYFRSASTLYFVDATASAIDLTSHIPANAGDARFVLLEVDSAGTVSAVDGNVFDFEVTDESEYNSKKPSTLSTTKKPCAYVLLKNGDTSVSKERIQNIGLYEVYNPAAGGANIPDSTHVIYVSKQGSDSNDGLNIAEAKLTISAAITAAIALSPLSTKRCTIHVIDSADYSEDVDCSTAYLLLYAPTATVRGKIEVGDNTSVVVGRVIPASGNAIVKKSVGTGLSVVKAEYVFGTCKNEATGGQLFLDIYRLDVPASDAGISGDTGANGHIHLNIHDIYLTGDSARGIRADENQVIVGIVHDIIEIGSYTNTKAIVLNKANCVVNLYVSRIIADKAYQFDVSNAVLNLFVGSMSGTRDNAAGGTENVIVSSEALTNVTDSSTINFTQTANNLTANVIEAGITHNNVGSLQGGTLGQYYHLTQNIYDLLSGSLVKGDLLYASADDTLARLTVGSEHQVLKVDSAGAPAWSTGARVLISTQTLGASGTFTFSSIPQTFTHLIIEFMLRGTVSANNDVARIFFNNDTTNTNYRIVQVTGDGAAASSGSADEPRLAGITAGTSPANNFTVGTCDILFYTNTSLNKEWMTRSERRSLAATQFGLNIWGNWENAAAITQIDIRTDNHPTDLFVIGSIVKLYGIT